MPIHHRLHIGPGDGAHYLGSPVVVLAFTLAMLPPRVPPKILEVQARPATDHRSLDAARPAHVAFKAVSMLNRLREWWRLDGYRGRDLALAPEEHESDDQTLHGLTCSTSTSHACSSTSR